MNGRCSRLRARACSSAQRVVEIDQHHHAGLGGDAGERDEADRDGDRQVEAEPPHQPQAADQRERHRQHDDQGLGHAAEVEVEQQEDDQHGDRHDDLQPRLGAFEIFELAAPGDVVAGRELDLRRPPPSARPRRSRRDRGRANRRRCRPRAGRSRCGCWSAPAPGCTLATWPSGTVPPPASRHQHLASRSPAGRCGSRADSGCSRCSARGPRPWWSPSRAPSAIAITFCTSPTMRP